jgi:hypothetical protein
MIKMMRIILSLILVVSVSLTTTVIMLTAYPKPYSFDPYASTATYKNTWISVWNSDSLAWTIMPTYDVPVILQETIPEIPLEPIPMRSFKGLGG